MRWKLKGRFHFTLLSQLYLVHVLVAQVNETVRPSDPAKQEFNLPDLKPSIRVPSGTLDRVETLIQEQRLEEARHLAEDLTSSEPGNGAAFYLLGYVLSKQQRFIPAIRALRIAEQLLPSDAEVHRSLGLIYYLLQQYRLFEEQMQNAKTASPANGEFDYWLGRYYEWKRLDYGRAISYFDRAISLDPANFKALYNRAYCREEEGDLVSAGRDYLRALDLIRKRGSADSWPFQALATLYLKTKHTDQALPLAREAVQLQPNENSNHLVLGKVLEQKGEVILAIQELRRAVELNPIEDVAHYRLYRLYLKQGNGEAAEKELAAFQEIRRTYSER